MHLEKNDATIGSIKKNQSIGHQYLLILFSNSTMLSQNERKNCNCLTVMYTLTKLGPTNFYV